MIEFACAAAHTLGVCQTQNSPAFGWHRDQGRSRITEGHMAENPRLVELPPADETPAGLQRRARSRSVRCRRVTAAAIFRGNRRCQDGLEHGAGAETEQTRMVPRTSRCGLSRKLRLRLSRRRERVLYSDNRGSERKSAGETIADHHLHRCEQNRCCVSLAGSRSQARKISPPAHSWHSSAHEKAEIQQWAAGYG